MRLIFNKPSIVLILFTTIMLACSKDKSQEELLAGIWYLKNIENVVTINGNDITESFFEAINATSITTTITGQSVNPGEIINQFNFGVPLGSRLDILNQGHFKVNISHIVPTSGNWTLKGQVFTLNATGFGGTIVTNLDYVNDMKMKFTTTQPLNFGTDQQTILDQLSSSGSLELKLVFEFEHEKQTI